MAKGWSKERRCKNVLYLIDCRSERFVEVLLFGHEANTALVTISKG
jgi:hypothetical protein